MTLDIAPGLPAIECDHYQLCQVFTNLIANAFEALDGKGTIAHRGVARRHRGRPGVRERAAGADADRRRGRGRQRPGRAGGAERSHLRSVLHDEDHRARAWGWHRHGRSSMRTTGASISAAAPSTGHAVPRHAAGHERNGRVQVERRKDDMGRILIADDHDALRRGLVRGLGRSRARGRGGLRTATPRSSGCTRATSTSC